MMYVRLLMAKPLAAALLMGAAVLTMLTYAPMSAQGAATTVTATYAGGITQRAAGDLLSNPSGVLRDGNNLYVLDSGKNRVVQYTLNITPSGPVTATYVRHWGSLGSGNTQFNNPQGITLSQNGRVTIADTGNNRVVQYTTAGAYSGQYGTFGSGNRQFKAPTDVAQSPINNSLYVLDSGNNRVQYFNPGNSYQGQFSASGGTPNQISGSASGISVGPDGSVMVADTGNHRILAFTAAGIPVRQTGSGPGSGLDQMSSPRDVEVGTDAFATVLDSGNNRVIAFNLAGSVPSPIQSFTAASTAVPGVTLPADPQFLNANDAIYGSDHLLIVADSGKNRIQFMWLTYGYDPVAPEYPLEPIGYENLSCTTCHLSDMRLEHDLKTSNGCISCHSTTVRNGRTDYSALGVQLAQERELMGYTSLGTCGSQSSYCHSVGSGQGYHAQDGARLQQAHWTYSNGVRATTSACSGTAGACHSYGSTASDLWFGSMDIASAHADYYAYQKKQQQVNGGVIPNLASGKPGYPHTSVSGSVDITSLQYGCTLCHDPNFYQSHGKSTKEAAKALSPTNFSFGCLSCHIEPAEGVPGYGSYSANPTCYRTEHWDSVGEFTASDGESVTGVVTSPDSELGVLAQVSSYIRNLIDSVTGGGDSTYTDAELDAVHGSFMGGEVEIFASTAAESLPPSALPASRPAPLPSILGAP